MMKNRFFIGLLSFFCFALTLFISLPSMAHEPLKGIQLALSGTNAYDAEPAVDAETTKIKKTESKESSKETPEKQQTDSKNLNQESSKSEQKETTSLSQDSKPKGIEQEITELRQEIQKIRSENEARKKLEVPEEEKGKEVEDILSAVGRQYTLAKKGTLGLSYGFSYSYYSSDAISEATTVERRSNHNLTNTISVDYALLNNLTLSTSIPFVYKYDRVGTSSAKEATDLGDMSVGLTVQPIKAGGMIPPIIFSCSVAIPTGTSPYDVDPNNTLATGSGLYGISGGISVSKVLDPVVAYGNLGYSYAFPKSGLDQYWSKTETLTEIEPGSSVSLAFGFGYALSYQVNINMGSQLTYSFGSKYIVNDLETFEGGSSLSSAFSIGTGWRVTPARSIYVSLGIGLTNNDSDFSLNFRVPFDF
jgi:hypothetical protein